MERPIIEIDEEKCDGCGQCVLDCAEGALAVTDGKARLISDVYCDGLGACLNCPQGALRLVTREAADFDEAAALAAKALRQKSSPDFSSGCPGSAPRSMRPLTPLGSVANEPSSPLRAALPSWPIQLRLIPPAAPFLQGSRLLLAAHCAGFALPDLHQGWLASHVPLIACPKLEDNALLQEKLTSILRESGAAGLEVLRMSVPCCSGLERLAHKALEAAAAGMPLRSHVIQLD